LDYQGDPWSKSAALGTSSLFHTRPLRRVPWRALPPGARRGRRRVRTSPASRARRGAATPMACSPDVAVKRHRRARRPGARWAPRDRRLLRVLELGSRLQRLLGRAGPIRRQNVRGGQSLVNEAESEHKEVDSLVAEAQGMRMETDEAVQNVKGTTGCRRLSRD
jgi:hypothetical protein